jgi:thiol-disulfide isomerase/thioredoxin
MAKTLSTMLALGTVAPDFTLKDTVSDESIKLSSHTKHSKGTLIMFICNHCPFVKHVNAELVKLAKDYANKPISILAISSNDIDNYPEDSPQKMKETAKQLVYTFPYLYDETQEVATLFQAACTPDFFLFDEHLKLVYRGQLDSSRPGSNIPVTGEDLRHAMNCLLDNKLNQEPQKPSMGCNIKWKNSI